MLRQDQKQFFAAGISDSLPAKRAEQQSCARWWSLLASIALHGMLLFLILFGDFGTTVGLAGEGGSILSFFEVGLTSLPGGPGQSAAPQVKKVFSDSSPKQKQQPESAAAPEDAIPSQVEPLKKDEKQATWEQQPEQAQGPQQGADVSGTHLEGGVHQGSGGGTADQHAGEGGLYALASSDAMAYGGRPFGFSLGQVSSKPKVVKSVPVVYPVEARKKRITGQVLVRFHLDEKGTISHLHIKSAEPANVFDQNTLAALRQWRFQPATHNKKAVPVWVELPLEFHLR